MLLSYPRRGDVLARGLSLSRSRSQSRRSCSHSHRSAILSSPIPFASASRGSACRVSPFAASIPPSRTSSSLSQPQSVSLRRSIQWHLIPLSSSFVSSPHLPFTATPNFRAASSSSSVAAAVVAPSSSSSPSPVFSSLHGCKTALSVVLSRRTVSTMVAPLTAEHTPSSASSPATGTLTTIEDATPTVTIEEEQGWVSRALRAEAKGKMKNIDISYRKLSEICRMVRRLSVEQALHQLKLSNYQKGVHVANAIRTASKNAVHNFNMDPDRLYVHEIFATKGVYYKRVEFRARGRANIKHRYHAHLNLTLKEQPYHEHEVRIGRLGRRIDTMQKVRLAMKEYKAAQPAAF